VQAWTDAMGVLETIRGRTPTLAAALLDLGYGAGHLDLWDEAEAAFRQAEAIAHTGGHGEDRLLAEAALAAVAGRQNPDRVTFPLVQSQGTEFSQRMASHLTAMEIGRG
jgi:hypothetical protein